MTWGEGVDIKKLIIIILGLCLIYDIVLIFSFEFLYSKDEKITAICEVISLKEETRYNNKYVVKILQNSKTKSTKLILYTNSSTEFIPGDILKICGEFNKSEKARNYKGFDYNNYLKQRKIYGIVYADNVSKIYTKKDIYYIRGMLLNNIIKKIHKLYNQDSQGFIEGILFGYTSNIEEQLIENFKIANISHILAISGLHISYVIYIMTVILRKTIKNKKLENYSIIFFLIFFWFITGESISCARACIMTIISIMSFNFYRKYNFYRSYIISIFIIVILNPFNFFNVGMWLSYLGLLGIKLFFDFFKTIFYHHIKVNEISRMIIQNIFISVSVQILIFPIIIYNFNTISLIFLLSNIIVFLFIDKIIILGYLSIFLSFINLNLGLFFSNINEILVNIFFRSIEILNSMLLSKIYVITPYWSSIFIYYFIIVTICIFYKRNKHYVLRLFCSFTFVQIQYKRVIYKVKRLMPYIVIIVILIFICVQIVNQFKLLNIYFVDVGQGDCTLIKTPKGKNILLDGGEGGSSKYDYGKNVVLPYLLDRRISKLDYVMISHFDSDHVGGIISIIKEIKVNKVIIGKQFETCENYEEFLNVIKKNKIQIQIVEAGDEICIEKNLSFYVLWPDSKSMINENVLNNNSLVCKLVYKDFSMLFTGDIEEIAEKSILEKYENNLKTDVLKVAHHGSKTSSTVEFLQKANPKYVLIGVGKNNSFGHPNADVIERLTNLRYNYL